MFQFIQQTLKVVLDKFSLDKKLFLSLFPFQIIEMKLKILDNGLSFEVLLRKDVGEVMNERESLSLLSVVFILLKRN
jgi:hypothetical protein